MMILPAGFINVAMRIDQAFLAIAVLPVAGGGSGTAVGARRALGTLTPRRITYRSRWGVLAVCVSHAANARAQRRVADRGVVVPHTSASAIRVGLARRGALMVCRRTDLTRRTIAVGGAGNATPKNAEW